MLWQLWQYRGSIQALVVLALTIVSWRRGAEPERTTAAILLAMVTVSWVYRQFVLPAPPDTASGGYYRTDPIYVLIDTTALLALLYVTMRANRVYPLWMTGFQLTATAMHFVNELVRSRAPFAYALLNMLPFYFMIGSQALGLWFHVRRQKRLGPYPSWQDFSGPSRERRRR